MTIETIEKDEVLRRFLSNQVTPNVQLRSDTWYTYGDLLVTNQGGWYLLGRSADKSVYMLSLDHPIAFSAAAASELRAEAMQAAKEVGASVLPVGDLAWHRAAGCGFTQTRDTTVIDVTDNLEAVFTIGDRYYLSGYDDQESPPLYFLCRIPHPVKTVDEARESLKPRSVADAESKGRRIVRQGDIFAIESPLTDDDLVELGADIYGPAIGPAQLKRHWPPLSRVPIYGTAHTSYHVARLPNNVMLAKGKLVHAPSIIGPRRTPDHVNRPSRRLGRAKDAWTERTGQGVPLLTPWPFSHGRQNMEPTTREIAKAFRRGGLGPRKPRFEDDWPAYRCCGRKSLHSKGCPRRWGAPDMRAGNGNVPGGSGE